MNLTKFRHSCLLVESGDARILFDPGTFAGGFEDLEGLTAVLITHQHPDHVDVQRLPAVLERNPQARVVADHETAVMLAEQPGIEAATANPGDVLDLGCEVKVDGGVHAEIHPDIPRIANVGYLVDGRLWHPGDSLVAPEGDIEILALPAVAPWMRIADAIDFYRAVAPQVALPIHDAITSAPALYYRLFETLGPGESRFTPLEDGEPANL